MQIGSGQFSMHDAKGTVFNKGFPAVAGLVIDSNEGAIYYAPMDVSIPSFSMVR
jgi:hypothetical protein